MSYNDNKFLQSALNNTTTTNGAGAYNSTLSDFLDFYYFAGTALPAIKNKTTFDYFNELSDANMQVVERFVKIFNKNPDYAMRLLYELRDIRSPIGGRGKKNVTALIYRYLANQYPVKMVEQLPNVVEYGSYKDLLWFMGTNIESSVIKFWWRQIAKDLNTDYPSLAAKWFPSENAGKRSTIFYQKFVEVLKLRPGFIRKVISSLRQKIEIVESKMSAQNWDKIEYSQVPSRAGKIYAKAFTKHDEWRYTSFLKSVERGEHKMNVTHVEMFELFKCLTNANQAQFQELCKLIASWIPEGSSILPVVDTSGSMNSWTGFNLGSYQERPTYSPMDIAIGCGIALAKCCKGPFENAMYEFNTNPKLHYIPSQNFSQLRQYVEKKFNWTGSTNLMAVFSNMLEIAKKNNLSNADLPKMIVILSDMQFNGGMDYRTFETIKQQYAIYGYNVPLIVWWSINGSSNNVPVTFNEVGTIMVSGYTQNVIKTIVTGAIMPIETIRLIVEHERYNKITW